MQRLVHRLAEDNARGLAFQGHFTKLASNQSLAVEGNTQRVDDTSQHTFAYHDGSDSLGTLHGEPFLDFVGRSQQHGTYIVFFQVHHNGFDAVVKLEQLVGFGIAQSVDTGHTVAYLKHRTDFVQLDAGIDAFELFAQDVGNFAYFYIFRQHCFAILQITYLQTFMNQSVCVRVGEDYTILRFLSTNCCFTFLNWVAILASSR